jgi:hypothetical protein
VVHPPSPTGLGADSAPTRRRLGADSAPTAAEADTLSAPGAQEPFPICRQSITPAAQTRQRNDHDHADTSLIRTRRTSSTARTQADMLTIPLDQLVIPRMSVSRRFQRPPAAV